MSTDHQKDHSHNDEDHTEYELTKSREWLENRKRVFDQMMKEVKSGSEPENDI